MTNIMRRVVPGVAGLIIAAAPVALVTSGAAGAATIAPARPAVVSHVREARLSWPVLRPGARGARVYTVQYLLKARGYRISADGRFGASTKKAVINFQRARHLVADGVVGAKTWRKLILVVKLGSRGQAVRAVQHSLRFSYHYRIAVDGVFGRATKTAVRKFQLKHRLVADGVVGTRTWLHLVAHEK